MWACKCSEQASKRRASSGALVKHERGNQAEQKLLRECLRGLQTCGAKQLWIGVAGSAQTFPACHSILDSKNSPHLSFCLICRFRRPPSPCPTPRKCKFIFRLAEEPRRGSTAPRLHGNMPPGGLSSQSIWAHSLRFDWGKTQNQNLIKKQNKPKKR